MCHHALWTTSASHSFSSLNSSFGLTGEKHLLKITLLSLDLFFKNCAVPGCFFYIIFYGYFFSFLQVGFVIVVCGSISVSQGISLRAIVN